VEKRVKRLTHSFYDRPTQIVAYELIGKILSFEQDGVLCQGKIVETEAYGGQADPASHAYRGKTPRNAVMFGPPGLSYVYFTYGNHHCFNIVTEPESVAGAVLIRALEPLKGIDVMRKRRAQKDARTLTSGPGKLTQAFGLTREHSGRDVTKAPLFLDENGMDSEIINIRATTRIGISRAKSAPLRFYLIDNPYVSVK
jgi:DNA-3-methyladenine glycosylase